MKSGDGSLALAPPKGVHRAAMLIVVSSIAASVVVPSVTLGQERSDGVRDGGGRSVEVGDVDARWAADADEAELIVRLIGDLVNIAEPYVGLSATVSGRDFVPVPFARRLEGGLVGADHGLALHSSFRRLVELGPKALPALLGALEDPRPTGLSIRPPTSSGAAVARNEVMVNPVNEREGGALARHPCVRPGARRNDVDIDEYTVCVGDVCFVLIGQITNRPYAGVSYERGGGVVINSPILDPSLAAFLRSLWRGYSPSDLLRFLLVDLGTRSPVTQPGVAPCVGAIPRLMFYFPSESRKSVEARVDELEIGPKSWADQIAANGTVGYEIARAAASVRDEGVGVALRRLALRADDALVLGASITPWSASPESSQILARVSDVLGRRPEHPTVFGGEYDLLRSSLRCFGVREHFDRVLGHQDSTLTRSVIYALLRAEARVDWAPELLRPLLDDTTALRWERPGGTGIELSVRICDEAAQAISYHVGEVALDLTGSRGDVDRRIERLRKRIDGGGWIRR